MQRTRSFVTALIAGSVLAACGGGSDGDSADDPSTTATVEEAVTAEPSDAETSTAEDTTRQPGPVEFREVVGSDLDGGCVPGDPVMPAAPGIPAPAPQAPGSPAAPTANRVAPLGAVAAEATCDTARFDALDCDAPPLPVSPDEVMYACEDAREARGDVPARPAIRYALAPARIVGGADATFGIPENGSSYSVFLELDAAGTAELAEMSSTMDKGEAGDYFAIVLDGRVLSAPYFTSVITDGNAQINGNFTEDGARQLAAAIAAAG